MSEVTPELIPLNEVLSTVKDFEEDSTYEASKATKNPKLKRHNQSNLNWGHSIHHYLKQLELINNTRAKK